jgi:hypothetical protein
MMMDDESGAVGGILGRETEIIGENCLNAVLTTTNLKLPDPDSNQGPLRWEAGD